MTIDYASLSWDCLTRLRARRPLVHNITNYVSMDVSANLLLAIGASPAMIHAEAEAAEFAGIVDALVVNIGTLSPPWLSAMESSAAVLRQRQRPWVLDPVGCGATAYRTRAARRLLEFGPAAIRGNASEIMTLAGSLDARVRGVDSTAGAEAAGAAASELARATGAIVAATGVVDRVTDGERVLEVANGHPLMASVTALGCALSAIVAALLAVHDDALEATAVAVALFGLAGEIAAGRAQGPGSLRMHFADVLHGLDEAQVLRGVRIAASAR